VKFSNGNIIQVDQANSNAAVFCLVGYNTSDASTKFYYSNYGGGLLKDNVTQCPALSTFSNSTTTVTTSTGTINSVAIVGGITGSWQIQNQVKLKDKKVLVAYYTEYPADTTQINSWTDRLKSFGYLTVDWVSEATMSTMTDATLQTYSLIILSTRAWSSSQITRMCSFIETHKINVIVEGNDNGANCYVKTSVQWAPNQAKFSPTYFGGLNPPFPYTFEKDTWADSDSGARCWTEIKPTAVVIATAPANDGTGNTCTLIFAAVSPTGGKWIQYSRIPIDRFSGDFVTSGLNWLNT
jgi:hypothetical protein